ncbi:MAG: hypothetical protein RLY87_2115 [Chloroflexota bacterium]
MSDSMRFFDSHAHLNNEQFALDCDAVRERMATAGVTRVCEIGYDLASSRRAIAAATTHPGCWAVVGVQPNHPEVAQDPTWLEQLDLLAEHPKVVAIGEIGFDHHYAIAPVAEQEALFRAQIGLAARHQLPIVIHSRNAHDDTLRVLSDVRHPYGVIMHSFSGDVAYAKACIAIGCVLSLSGPITFKNNHTMHDVVRAVGLEHLLIETDSPYLSPHPHRGKRNEPTNVPLVAAFIAATKNIGLTDVAEATWHNANRVFGLSDDTP